MDLAEGEMGLAEGEMGLAKDKCPAPSRAFVEI